MRSRAPLHDRAGFTLLELMLVLIVSGLMAAVAYSAHVTYSIRAQVGDAIAATSTLRTAIADAYQRQRRAPDDESSEPPAADAGRFVGARRIVTGRIDLVFGAEAGAAITGRTLSLTPYETADLEIVWICGNRIPGPGLEPLGFSAGGPRAVQAATTIEARFLPPSCR